MRVVVQDRNVAPVPPDEEMKVGGDFTLRQGETYAALRAMIADFQRSISLSRLVRYDIAGCGGVSPFIGGEDRRYEISRWITEAYERSLRTNDNLRRITSALGDIGAKFSAVNRLYAHSRIGEGHAYIGCNAPSETSGDFKLIGATYEIVKRARADKREPRVMTPDLKKVTRVVFENVVYDDKPKTSLVEAGLTADELQELVVGDYEAFSNGPSTIVDTRDAPNDQRVVFSVAGTQAVFAGKFGGDVFTATAAVTITPLRHVKLSVGSVVRNTLAFSDTRNKSFYVTIDPVNAQRCDHGGFPRRRVNIKEDGFSLCGKMLNPANFCARYFSPKYVYAPSTHDAWSDEWVEQQRTIAKERIVSNVMFRNLAKKHGLLPSRCLYFLALLMEGAIFATESRQTRVVSVEVPDGAQRVIAEVAILELMAGTTAMDQTTLIEGRYLGIKGHIPSIRGAMVPPPVVMTAQQQWYNVAFTFVEPCSGLFNWYTSASASGASKHDVKVLSLFRTATGWKESASRMDGVAPAFAGFFEGGFYLAEKPGPGTLFMNGVHIDVRDYVDGLIGLYYDSFAYRGAPYIFSRSVFGSFIVGWANTSKPGEFFAIVAWSPRGDGAAILTRTGFKKVANGVKIRGGSYDAHYVGPAFEQLTEAALVS